VCKKRDYEDRKERTHRKICSGGGKERGLEDPERGVRIVFEGLVGGRGRQRRKKINGIGETGKIVVAKKNAGQGHDARKFEGGTRLFRRAKKNPLGEKTSRERNDESEKAGAILWTGCVLQVGKGRVSTRTKKKSGGDKVVPRGKVQPLAEARSQMPNQTAGGLWGEWFQKRGGKSWGGKRKEDMPRKDDETKRTS